MEDIPEWMLLDLKRRQVEKGCKEMCKTKNDIRFCLHCMMGTATPEIIDERIDRVLDDVQKNIDKYGWYVIVVQSPKTKKSFGYSIGLWETFKHPEIIILGSTLSFETIKGAINNIGMQIKKKRKIFTQGEISNTVMTMPVKFIKVNKKYYKKYFKMWYNRYDTFDIDFDALQMLWTDRAGIFPDEYGYSEEFKHQVILS